MLGATLPTYDNDRKQGKGRNKGGGEDDEIIDADDPENGRRIDEFFESIRD